MLEKKDVFTVFSALSLANLPNPDAGQIINQEAIFCHSLDQILAGQGEVPADCETVVINNFLLSQTVSAEGKSHLWKLSEETGQFEPLGNGDFLEIWSQGEIVLLDPFNPDVSNPIGFGTIDKQGDFQILP
jgi:hypothetical protein